MLTVPGEWGQGERRRGRGLLSKGQRPSNPDSALSGSHTGWVGGQTDRQGQASQESSPFHSPGLPVTGTVEHEGWELWSQRKTG